MTEMQNNCEPEQDLETQESSKSRSRAIFFWKKTLIRCGECAALERKPDGEGGCKDVIYKTVLVAQSEKVPDMMYSNGHADRKMINISNST